MNLFLLGFISLCLSSGVYSQTCEPPKEHIIINGCKFLGKVTNPVRECMSASCKKCENYFSEVIVRAAGNWQVESGSVKNWDATDSKSTMVFDENTCLYTLEVNGLEKSKKYEWKVPINNEFKESYGCGKDNCQFETNSEGSVKLEFHPIEKRLSSSELEQEGCTSCKQNEIVNPHEECYSQEYCPDKCDNNLADNLLHVSGDWLVDASIGNNWDPSVKDNLMTYDYQDCQYSLKVRGLKSRGNYTWKVRKKFQNYKNYIEVNT